ncbi:MAG: radical SAM protein [Candidatus Omnitrophota bacterium]
MRIVLVNIPWKKGTRWGVRAGSRWPHIKDRTEDNYLAFPFYLAYAAALLKKNKFEVFIIDAIAERLSYKDFFQKVISLKPDLLVAETSTVSLKHDLNFLLRLKGLAEVAICGPDVHIADPKFLQETSQVDYVLFGEYEATLLELAQTLRGNYCKTPICGVSSSFACATSDEKDASSLIRRGLASEHFSIVPGDRKLLDKIDGLIFRDKGRIIKNKPRPLISDLDWLPWPMRKQLPIKRYNDAPGDIPIPCASMWASRGCPFRCSFCLWPQVMYNGNSYRTRDVKSVVDEMEYLIKKLGFKSIYFDDDTWNIGEDRIYAFCEELNKRELNIPWAIMARAELMDEALLEAMRKAGLFAVKYGIESSSQEILDKLGKGLDLKKAEEVIKYTKYLGIRTHLTFTFGLPGETQQSIQDTINYALKLNPTSVQFSIATPFPGTRFYEEMEKKGYLLTKDLEKFDGNHSSVIRTEHLSGKQLQKAKKTAYAEWDKHYQLKNKKLFFKNKPLKVKLMSSLVEQGVVLTAIKILRFIIRRVFFFPLRVKQLFTRKLWIIEEIVGTRDLRLKFGEGRVKVFWKDKEISKDVGLTTSLHYGDCWFDSTQANWKLEKQSGDKIKVKLKWDEVPVRQEWDIEIIEDRQIKWVSTLQVEKSVQLLEYKAGIMVSDSYTKWRDDLGIGKFPKISGWEEIELYNSNSAVLRVIADEGKGGKTDLPELEMRSACDLENNTYPQIQNTDCKINARILQMRKLKIAQFTPGDYKYFDLEIVIENKQLVPQTIDKYKKRVPLQFIKEQISAGGFFPVLMKILKHLHPRRLSDYYLDIIGVLDGSYAYKGPSFVQIDLTNDCNNDCIGCWCNSPLLGDKKIDDTVKRQTLPFETVKKTIDELAGMGTKEIYFAGGGEPFMHPEILPILEHVKKRRLGCYINTNFTLVNEDVVKRLAELKVDNLIVSVWAGTPETYCLTHPNKSEGMFYQIKGMLRLLSTLKQGVPNINIYNVISNLNYHELEEMVEFAVDAHADSLEFTVIDTIPNATDSLLLSDQQRKIVLESCQRIQKRLEEDLKGKIKVLQFEQFVRRIDTRDAQEAKYDKNILEQMPCYIGWLFARILADGNVNFCLKSHRIPVGNIYAQDFSDIWNSQRQQEFRKRSLCADKNDVFFSFIGNDPNVKVGCFKSCDDLARNVRMHKKLQSLTFWELKFLSRVLFFKKLQKAFRNKKLGQVIRSQIKKRQLTAGKHLSRGDLRLESHSDGIKLYWADRQLTESVGLNSSVCIFGLWYDSSKAEWEIKKHTDTEIIIKNVWHKIPIAQNWELKVKQGNVVSWNINLSVESKIEIEETKTSIMLSSDYRKWQTQKEQGKFPLLSFWNEADINDLSVKNVGVARSKGKGGFRPGIDLNFSDMSGDTRPQIQNADKSINARIISARCVENNGGKVFLPGEYKIFSGEIVIRSDDV